MKTTELEAFILAEKVNPYRAPVTGLIPRRAVSVIFGRGQAFHDPAAGAPVRNACW